MNKFIKYLLYVWQLLQNIIGLIFIWVMKPEHYITLENGNKVYFSSKMDGGISLGMYSIIDIYYWKSFGGNIDKIKNQNVVKHEGIGHGTQSKWLGPLYLIIIGFPSLIWAWLYGRIIPYTNNGYYKFYTEKWADKIAGIKR